MVEISSEIENLLIETTQCDNLEKALKFIFTDYLIMKIHLYSQKIIKFQDKWNMDFHKFKEKVHTQKDFHTYNYERDVWEWEEAMTLKNHYEGVKEKVHISEFIKAVQSELSQLNYIQETSIESEVFTARIKVKVKDALSIYIFYNQKTGTLSYALLNQYRRIWGIDCNDPVGWHEHTFENPEGHILIKPKNVYEVIRKLHTILQIIIYDN